MATTTPNFGWDVPQSTDLVKDGATAIAALGNDIDTSLVDLKGGTTGQVLSKASGTDMDFTWVAQDDSNAIQNALLTTTGDTIYASGASTPARLGIGTSGQVLTVSGGVPAWTTLSSSGIIKITNNLSFTGQSAVNFDNCFTSTYTNYFIILDNIIGTTSSQLAMRMRASSSNNTTSNYYQGNQPVVYTTGTTGGEQGTNQSSFTMMGSINVSSSLKASMMFYVNNPQTSVATTWQGIGNNTDAGFRVHGQFNGTTSFDGISFYPTAGTFSGNITVYAYEK